MHQPFELGLIYISLSSFRERFLCTNDDLIFNKSIIVFNNVQFSINSSSDA